RLISCDGERYGFTSRVAVLLVPLAVTEITAELATDTVRVFTAKSWLTLPTGKVRLLTVTLATDGSLLESATEMTPGPAGASNVTIPSTGLPPTTGFGRSAT